MSSYGCHITKFPGRLIRANAVTRESILIKHTESLIQRRLGRMGQRGQDYNSYSITNVLPHQYRFCHFNEERNPCRTDNNWTNKKGFSRTKFLLVMVQLNSQILQNSQNEFTHINKYFKSLISTRKNTKQQQTLYIETN